MSTTLACPRCSGRIDADESPPSSSLTCPACGETFDPHSTANQLLQTILRPWDDSVPPPPLPDPTIGETRIAAQIPESRPEPSEPARRAEPSRNQRRADNIAVRPRSKRRTIAIVVGAIAVVAAGAFGFGALRHVDQDRTPRPELAVREHAEPPEAAFPAAEEEAAKREVAELLRQMPQAVGNRGLDALIDMLDADRALEEAISGGFGAGLAKESNVFAVHFRLALKLNLTAGYLEKLDGCVVRQIRKIRNDEAVAVCTLTGKTGDAVGIRWWLTRRSGRWMVYDMETVVMGLRLSLISAARMRMPGDARLADTILALDECLEMLFLHRTDDAEKLLNKADRGVLPRKLKSLQSAAKGYIAVERGQIRVAAEEYSLARDFQRENPGLDYLEGILNISRNEFADALALLDRYHALIGDGKSICYFRGRALQELRRFEEARQAFRTSLRLGPDNKNAVLGLAQTLLGHESRDELEEAFGKLSQPEQAYPEFIADALGAKDWREAEAFSAAMLRRDPKHLSAELNLAAAQARLGKTEEAIRHLKNVAAADRDVIQSPEGKQALEALGQAGKGSLAYELAADRKSAFVSLALASRFRPKELRELLALHGKKFPNDPAAMLFEADLLARRGKFAEADAKFSEAIKRSPPENLLVQFRSDRILARYRLGKGLSAYEDIGPRGETFRQLVGLATGDKNRDLIQKLVAAHAALEPDDPELPIQRALIALREKKTPENVDRLRKAVAAAAKPMEMPDQSFLWRMVDEGLALEAYEASDDKAKAFRFLSSDLLEQGRSDLHDQLVDLHRKTHPNDSEVALFDANALSGEGKWAEAAAKLRDLAKNEPKDRRQALWPYCSAMAKLGRAIEALREFDFAPEAFQALRSQLRSEKNGEALKTLTTEFVARRGESAQTHRAFAAAAAMDGKPGEAFARLAQARAAEKGPPPIEFETFGILVERGLALPSYRLAGENKEKFFDEAARTLGFSKKKDELARLIAERVQDVPDDPNLLLHRGTLLLLKGDAVGALASLDAYVAKFPDKRFRASPALEDAYVAAGKAAEGWRKHPGNSAFALMQACIRMKRPDQLESLLSAYRASDPDDDAIPIAECELLWLKQDYAGLCDRYKNRNEFGPNDWSLRNYALRSLVRLKRFDEARRMIDDEARANRRVHDVLALLPSAAAGDVKKTTEEFAKLRRSNRILENDVYRDEDLGPLLRSPPFASFRERFPEPKALAPQPIDID